MEEKSALPINNNNLNVTNNNHLIAPARSSTPHGLTPPPSKRLCKLCNNEISSIWADGHCSYHSPNSAQYFRLCTKANILKIPIPPEFYYSEVVPLSGPLPWPHLLKDFLTVIEKKEKQVGEGKSVSGLMASPRAMAPILLYPMENHEAALFRVVFDLDETLVRVVLTQKEVRPLQPASSSSSSPTTSATRSHPASRSPSSRTTPLVEVIPLGSNSVVVRPGALDMLSALSENKIPVYVLSSGSKEYVFSVCKYLNERTGISITNGASCRLENMFGEKILKKKFEHVIPQHADSRYAVAVDNSRRVWDPTVRNQVMIIPDFIEKFKQILGRIEVNNTLQDLSLEQQLPRENTGSPGKIPTEAKNRPNHSLENLFSNKHFPIENIGKNMEERFIQAEKKINREEIQGKADKIELEINGMVVTEKLVLHERAVMAMILEQLLELKKQLEISPGKVISEILEEIYENTEKTRILDAAQQWLNERI